MPVLCVRAMVLYGEAKPRPCLVDFKGMLWSGAPPKKKIVRDRVQLFTLQHLFFYIDVAESHDIPVGLTRSTMAPRART